MVLQDGKYIWECGGKDDEDTLDYCCKLEFSFNLKRKSWRCGKESYQRFSMKRSGATADFVVRLPFTIFKESIVFISGRLLGVSWWQG